MKNRLRNWLPLPILLAGVLSISACSDALIHKSGELEIPTSAGADLDRGVVSDESVDIRFETRVNANGEVVKLLSPTPGVSLGVADAASICEPEEWSDIDIEALPSTFKVCVLTDEGRLTDIKVLGMSDSRTLRISFITWRKGEDLFE